MVAAILINTFVYAIDNTIVAVIQPVSQKDCCSKVFLYSTDIQAIADRFGNISNLPWLSVGYSVQTLSTLYFAREWLQLIMCVKVYDGWNRDRAADGGTI